MYYALRPFACTNPNCLSVGARRERMVDGVETPRCFDCGSSMLPVRVFDQPDDGDEPYVPAHMVPKGRG